MNVVVTNTTKIQKTRYANYIIFPINNNVLSYFTKTLIIGQLSCKHNVFLNTDKILHMCSIP